MTTFSLRYWAGAKAAAGVDSEVVEARSVNEALARVRDQHADSNFSQVLSVSSILVNGLVVRGSDLDEERVEPVRVEVLPPFAGGAPCRPHLRLLRTSPLYHNVDVSLEI